MALARKSLVAKHPNNSASHPGSVSKGTRNIHLGRALDCSIGYLSPACIALIAEWSLWENTETSRLHYRLRQSYYDRRLLCEAPGHLFLGYEVEDFASFLVVSMLNGWGGHILTEANYLNAFLSHDEYVDFYADQAENLESVKEEFLLSK